MATIFKNPYLSDYFVDVDDIGIKTPLAAIPSFVPQYEAAKVLYFSGMRPEIDFDFWASLDTENNPGFKKLTYRVDADPNGDQVDRALERIGGPPDLAGQLTANIQSLLGQVMPIYHRIFGDYEFSMKRSVWRIQTIYNENLHFDTYAEKEFPDHFARMFINLDNQPRIWYTSFTADEAFERFGKALSTEVIESPSDAWYWHRFSTSVFGKNSRDWWDGQPRHIIYFDPGDVWVVDSRQVAHQIFYGRRAVSIDFVVPRKSMLDSSRHYLTLASRQRTRLKASA